MKAEEYSERGMKYWGEDNFNAAIADFTEVIKLEPNNPFAYCKRGMSYRSKKEFDLAIADFTEAIRLKSNESGFYFERALAYIIKGEKVLALADFETAAKLDPQNEDYREALGDLKEEMSNTNTGNKTDVSIRKEIIGILVGAIIVGIIGASIGAVSRNHSIPLVFAIIFGLWAGLGIGGNITFVLYLFIAGWDAPPFMFGWQSDRSESFLFNLVMNLIVNTLGLAIKLFLAFLFTGAGLAAFVAAGPIWPLIRILIKKGKLNKN